MRVWGRASGRRPVASGRAFRLWIAGLALSSIVLGGCAGDYARRDNAPVAAAVYEADLDACRSSATAAKAAGSAQGFLVGALLGAAHGAAAGAHHGSADVGAAIGASVGAVIGFVQGLAWSDRSSISSCMYAKGYRRA